MITVVLLAIACSVAGAALYDGLKSALQRVFLASNVSRVHTKIMVERSEPGVQARRTFFEFEGGADSLNDALDALAETLDQEADIPPEAGGVVLVPDPADDRPEPGLIPPGPLRSQAYGAYRLQKAKEAWEEACRADNDADAERGMRLALELAVSAFNWLEDSEYEEAVHDLIHGVGRGGPAKVSCRLSASLVRFSV